jgi:alpha,alpha-trehalose phosphorylase
MTPNHAAAARLRERLEERLSRSPSERSYPVSDWQIVERRFEPEYGTIIRLFVDDEPFDLATAKILRFERVLDMPIGVLSREVEFETKRGQRMLVRSRRLASLEHRHLAAMDYEVVALDADVRIAVSSELVTYGPGEASDDPRRGKAFAEKVLVPMTSRASDHRAVLEMA